MKKAQIKDSFLKKKSGSVNSILCGVVAIAFLGIGSGLLPETEITEQEFTTESMVESPTEELYNEIAFQESGIHSSTTENIEQQSLYDMEVHFIDVGQADAALVLCGGEAMLIDGGNTEDSNLMYSYLKNHSVSYLDYIVATHAHEDHVGGLAGALNYAGVGAVYCPVTSYDSEAFSDFKQYVEKASSHITVPSVGDCFELGNAVIEILGLNAGSETNDTSIILKITHGDVSFLFVGDAEREAEQAVLNRECDLKSTVLKVGHHGSDSSTTYPFLREIMPTYAIISVGENNSYGHPTEAVLSRLRDADVKVFRTDLQGDIIAVSDTKNVTINVKKNADADTLVVPATPTPNPTPKPTPQAVTTSNTSTNSVTETKGAYAVNGNNGKIHIVGECSATGSGKNAMNNPVFFDTFDQAEQHSIAIAPSQDKRKCGNCW